MESLYIWARRKGKLPEEGRTRMTDSFSRLNYLNLEGNFKSISPLVNIENVNLAE